MALVALSSSARAALTSLAPRAARGYAASAATGAMRRAAGAAEAAAAGEAREAGRGPAAAGEASTSWVPDPVTGHYRPANWAAAADPADLRAAHLARAYARRA